MNTNIELAQKFLANKTGRLGLVLQKYAPEIMLGAGLTTIVVATVMACKASTKVEEALRDSKREIHHTKNNIPLDSGPGSEYQKDLALSYIHAGIRFVKLYGPSVSLGAAGVICVLGSHGIMKQRQVALVAAYNVVSESFNLYKKRIVEELGEEKEYALRHGTTVETVEGIDPETGKKKKVKAQIINEKTRPSEYSRFFDENSKYWQRDASANRFFISMKQNYLNDLFLTRGHLFLNEVYDELGLPRSKAGSITGWVRGKGDEFVDFGMFRFGNEDFINGYERSVLLDFNVCGVIYDLI